MNIKQLLLTPIFCIFSSQAMQEAKVEQEESKKVQESIVSHRYQEINQFCPNSVKFLIKILGPQKDKKGKTQSEIIKNGLTDDLIYEICEYLFVNLFCFPYRTSERCNMTLSTDFNDMLKKMTNHLEIDGTGFVNGMVIKPNRHNYFDVELYLRDPAFGEIARRGDYFFVNKTPILHISSEASIYQEMRKILLTKEALGIIVFIIAYTCIFSELVS